MKRLIKLVLLFGACVAFVGCARPLIMAPDLGGIQGKGITKIEKQVGYFISDANQALEVITPGGGGDKVRYFPYRDIEPGFYKALGEVFKGATKLKNLADNADITAKGISLVIVPSISTTSSSPSLLTWPPTKFSVTLGCTITNADGSPLKLITVTGSGAAEFDEFKANVSLSALRATNDALDKLMQILSNTPELRR